MAEEHDSRFDFLDELSTPEETVETPKEIIAEEKTDSVEEPEKQNVDELAELKKQLDEYKAKTENLEKRAKDNQAAFTKSQQELAELKKRQASGNDDDDWFKIEDSQEKEPAPEEKEDRIAEVAKKTEELERNIRVQQWETKEQELKKANSDYDDAVDILAKCILTDSNGVPLPVEQQINPFAKKYFESGCSPENAYKVGKELLDVADIGKKQTVKKISPMRSDDSNLNSLGTDGSSANMIDDPIDDVLSFVHRKK